MKLENQVNSIEQGKRLAKLGVTAESLFIHYRGLMTEKHGVLTSEWMDGKNVKNACNPAYTVAELGVMLTGSDMAETTVWDAKKYSWTFSGTNESKEYDTEAECRADMLIYLLENKHITSEECNERLKNA